MNKIAIYGPKSREEEIRNFYRVFGTKEFYKAVDTHGDFAVGTSTKDGSQGGIYLFRKINDESLLTHYTLIHLPNYTLESDIVCVMYFLQTREERAKAKFDKINTQINSNRKRINEISGHIYGRNAAYELKGLSAENYRLKKVAKKAFTDYLNIYNVKQRLIHSMTAEEFNKFYEKFCEYIRKRR